MNAHNFIPNFDAQDYASRGTTILGIRDTGKSTTAQLIGELLNTASIPWIAFDPTGQWKFMRVPGVGKGGRGFPIVVAGGTDGDLPLTPETAPKIVRAAMEQGVSLVIDLYSFDLSKADHRRIVEACVRVLLYENGKYGLRHIFVEEAAEFVPQRIGPDQGKVYAIMEALARMGGNARLGYTLINQRGEQVNKAVVELCDNLLLFRQKGRNSITALSKWLDVADAAGAKEVIKSLATLPQATCWAWMAGSARPVLVKMPKKKSFMPDRRAVGAHIDANKRPLNADASAFVAKMREDLAPKPKHAPAPKTPTKQAAPVVKPIARAELLAEFKRGYGEGRAAGYAKGYSDAIAKVAPHLGAVAAAVERFEERWKIIVTTPKNAPAAVPPPKRNGQALTFEAKPLPVHVPKPPPAEGVSRPQQAILDALAWLAAVNGISDQDRVAVAFIADASPSSSTFANNLGALRTAGLIDYPTTGRVRLTDTGNDVANAPPNGASAEQMRSIIIDRLPRPLQKMLGTVFEAYPNSIGREDLASATESSATSSTFANNLGRLRTLGLLEYPERGQVKATEVLFP